MDKNKAREFIKELNKLEEKYGFRIASSYEEEIDYDYEESPYVSGVHSYLTLIDEEGIELSLDDLESDHFTCYYCGRDIEDDDRDFCNKGCEESYKKDMEI